MALILPFVKTSRNARSPIRASVNAAGLDLFATHEISINPGKRARVKTDIQVAIPRGFYGRIAPRSGLTWEKGLDVGGGVVDADFRGSIDVILFNHGSETAQISCHDRIAQLIIEKIGYLEPKEVTSLERTVRDSGGFGSSGK